MTLAILVLVVPMPFVVNAMVLDHALAYLNTSAILIVAVDQNVYKILIVIVLKLVSITNVSILAQVSVVSMLSVVFLIMLPTANVSKVIPEIHTVLVLFRK